MGALCRGVVERLPLDGSLHMEAAKRAAKKAAADRSSTLALWSGCQTTEWAKAGCNNQASHLRDSRVSADGKDFDLAA